MRVREGLQFISSTQNQQKVLSDQEKAGCKRAVPLLWEAGAGVHEPRDVAQSLSWP